jgi:hypothetical protein
MIQPSTEAVRLLAADDVASGEFVVVMSEIAQFPSFYWCSEGILSSRAEMISLSYIPEEAGRPLLVIDVCVPFLLVEDVAGIRRILDVRRTRVARVPEKFALKVKKSLAKNGKIK